jgi:hypothetical protein
MSQTIYETYPTINPRTHFVCVGPEWIWSTLYRNIPAFTSANVVLSQATPPPSIATPTSDEQGSIAATSTGSSSSTGSSPVGKPSSHHTGLIVGVVLGVIAALVVLSFGFFILRRKQRSWKEQNHIAELEDSSPAGYGFRQQNRMQQLPRHIGSSTTVIPDGPPVLSTVHPALAAFYAKYHYMPSSVDMYGASPTSAGVASGSAVGIYSPAPAPVVELDAVDSAIRLELPAERSSVRSFIDSPTQSQNVSGKEREYAGDGHATDSDGQLNS